MTTTIGIANQKGGVGKTTTTVTLAHGLARCSQATLIVDLDPQGQVASSLGIQREPGIFDLFVKDYSLEHVARQTGRPFLDVVTGDKSSATAQIVLDARRSPLDTLYDIINPGARNRYRFVILDTSPSIGGLQEQALYAADLVLVPTAVDYLSTEGVAYVLETLAVLARKHSWRGQLLGILPTFYDDSTRESRQVIGELAANYGQALLEPAIHRATILRECSAAGVTIFEQDPRNRAAREYGALIDLVMRIA